MLADAGIVVWVFGILVIGFVAFFAVLISMILRGLRFVFRLLASDSPGPQTDSLPEYRVCPHPGCGQVNTPGARYCARCGRALRTRKWTP